MKFSSWERDETSTLPSRCGLVPRASDEGEIRHHWGSDRFNPGVRVLPGSSRGVAHAARCPGSRQQEGRGVKVRRHTLLVIADKYRFRSQGEVQ